MQNFEERSWLTTTRKSFRYLNVSGATLKSFRILQDNDQYDSGDLNTFRKDAEERRKGLSSFNYSSIQYLVLETQTPLLISCKRKKRVPECSEAAKANRSGGNYM